MFLFLTSVGLVSAISYTFLSKNSVNINLGGATVTQDLSTTSVKSSKNSKISKEWVSGIDSTKPKRILSCDIKLNGVADVKINSVKLSSARVVGVTKEQPGQVILVDYYYKNTSNNKLVINADNFIIEDRKGIILTEYPLTEADGVIEPVEVEPNEEGRGVLAFAPKTASADVKVSLKYPNSSIRSSIYKVHIQ